MGPITRTTPFRILHYECVQRIGGNMADVYVAHDTITGKQVVIKILRRTDDPEMIGRFAREAELAKRCRHPNIVATWDSGEDRGSPFLVMEFVPGWTLRQWIDQRRLTGLPEVIGVATQIARALQYIHQQQITHRDIKPENILVDRYLNAKILDLGVARVDDSSLTRTGRVVGTPRYVAPEQVDGGRVMYLSDIYSFGVVLYEMLTWEWPYGPVGQTLDAVYRAILYTPPNMQKFQEFGADPHLVAVIQKCLEKDPARRFQSFDEVIAALERYLNPQASPAATVPPPPTPPPPQPPPAPNRWLVPVFAAALIILILSALFIFREPILAMFKKGNGGVIRKDAIHNAADPLAAMAFIPAGEALLGKDAKPTFVPDFYIDKTEVSNRQYLSYANTNGIPKPEAADSANPDHPVVRVSFDDARQYCQALGKRLPSALEWEKAARSTDGRKFPWGNALRTDYVNLQFDPQSAENSVSMPVSSLEVGASPYGVLHLLGNVWEWVEEPVTITESEFTELIANLPGTIQPPPKLGEPLFQIRGGGAGTVTERSEFESLVWDHSAMLGRLRHERIGFRCARSK